MPKSVAYDEYLAESLKDAKLAEEYLKAALEDSDQRVFLQALRNVALARGVANVAARSKLNRESLYPDAFETRES